VVIAESGEEMSTLVTTAIPRANNNAADAFHILGARSNQAVGSGINL
jgi:hypothetical protein